MDIDYRYINSNKLPKEILQIENLLKNLSGGIKDILESELRAGNIIYDVIENCPEEDWLQISLEKAFVKNYSIEGIEKHIHNDPHNSCIEYSSSKNLVSIISPA
ncbi:MAG: hypothetical protein NE327_08740 [Lentisphaeraceae bacterium]|nr:hypothetical protein [Lentisphaeraceae bacterium]